MNVNEVIANRAISWPARAGRKHPAHPNDHVNMSPVVQRRVSHGHALAAARTSRAMLLPRVR